MSNTDQELAKMIRSFRVSDLQTLLVYGGRNKNGKKTELQYRALELIKLRSAAIDMKIREIHMNKFGGHSRVQAVENAEMYVPPALPVHTRMNRGIVMPNSNKSVNGSNYIDDMYERTFSRNPDVRLRELPLFDVLAELIRPTTLVKLLDNCFKENEFVFFLTQQQVIELQTNSDISVQVRMCLLDTSCEQDDEIPTSCCLKVNYMMATLPAVIPTNRPGTEPKRPRKPIDISNLIKKSSCDANVINVSWAAANSENRYIVACYLVKKVSSSTLIRRLKAKGVRNPDHTTSIIKEKLLQDQDSEIASTNLKGSLLCPLGKIKMQLPTRALTCTHLQCFDGNLFIQMNEKKPKWICPVCDKPAYFKNLVIDGLFLDIISKAPNECNEVQFHDDGSWTPVVVVKKQEEVSDASIELTITKTVPKVTNVEVAKPKKPVEVISLDSDSDTEDSWSVVLPPKKKVCKPLSLSMSPVLLESPEHTQESRVKMEDSKTKAYNQFLPGTSNQEQPCTAKSLPTIPERSSLAPLPEALDIDSSDVDCILGDVPSASGPLPSASYENVTPSESPDVYVPPKTTFPESVEVLPNNSQRHFGDFDLFSLIQPDTEMNYNFSPAAEEEASPDIINID